MSKWAVMSSLSSQPYKGTRDYYPEDMRVRNYIFRTWKTVAERFGYEEYAAPMLEPLEVYAAKSGTELVNEQTYAFVDKGDRKVAIRPEMTPSISRMVAAKRQELPYPARLFSIANFMRYERPQRGREREFWQLNVDVFGLDGILPEAEIIQLGAELLKEFGAKKNMYVIKLNNRRVIDAMMRDYLSLDEVGTQLMMKLFDRKNKITSEDFRDQAIDIFGQENAPAGLKKISELLLAKELDQLPSAIKDNDSIVEVKQLVSRLKKSGITNVQFDVTLMRGLDYYTGTVFEFFDTDPENNRSLFGGGRYDGLVGLFGAEPISAVGMAPGLTTTELFLQSHKLLPEFVSTTEVYMIVLGENMLDDALELATKFRSEDVNIEVDMTGRRTDKQIRTALKKGIPFMLFIGEEELKKEQYNFKDTKTSDEQQLSFERIVAAVKDRRHKSGDDIDELFD